MPPLPHPLATLLSILLSLTLLLSFYIYQSPTSLTFTTPHLQTTNGIPGLTFSLSQISTSPPALLVTLQNNHPETTYTLLKWATPLDASALDTGVFSITTADGKAVEQVVRRITRKMPPPPNQIVELAPGRNVSREVLFDKSAAVVTGMGKYRVEAKGVWKGGWARNRAEITTKDLWAFGESEFAGSRFVIDGVEMIVE
ncbi:hypothetical protein L13192_04929 [Pyrenophora tritici-repentis]|uniref:Uncharacterized protein n=2 Tax=Pyrenophora tritici-repentis TaxID=45151 RepID=A0A922NE59_9PLEO|nr:uncharacterized protein PTRG_09981 [Pyrenophora tritici-repentis Pt-1C-BFP]EDU43032.1 predicted protein [Pyrenophora tritici-repentis Pt-1C-BFP]KAI1516184.1 hypothetical protein Ptr86124_004721 [Pyrenophora tritici-repentis]KAI1671572.1 hypothetical protein L13192_04929 [Pyrenophora tritici-repentis]KAI1685408.1 hypothetical protein KJE20_05692 [Pyrenophora tritici-repentis]